MGGCRETYRQSGYRFGEEREILRHNICMETYAESRPVGQRIFRKKGAVNLAEKKEKLTAFMQDEENQKLLHLLWRQAGGVFRHIRPRKLRLYLRFGFEDPYWTGKVLGYASMFYAYYHKNVELVPEFEQEVLEGNLYAKGRVRAGTLMAKGARLLLDKGFRNMLKKVLRRT